LETSLSILFCILALILENGMNVDD